MKPDDLLAQIAIPTPCSANWDQMDGDRRSRLCQDCGKTVYDLAELTEPEVVDLWKKCDNDLCGRITRRNDGKIVTRQAREPFRFTIGTMMAIVASVATFLGFIKPMMQPRIMGSIRSTISSGIAPTTPAGSAGVTCEDFSSAPNGADAPLNQ